MFGRLGHWDLLQPNGKVDKKAQIAKGSPHSLQLGQAVNMASKQKGISL